jgi:hypothetical protein
MDQRAWLSLALSVLPLIFFFSVVGILVISGFFDWFGGKIADRSLGKGQSALWRQALREEAIPHRADTAAWRAALVRTKEPSTWPSMVMPALLLLLAIWFVISSRDLADVVANMAFVLMSVGLGSFVFVIRRRQMRERRLIVRLLDGHAEDQ